MLRTVVLQVVKLRVIAMLTLRVTALQMMIILPYQILNRPHPTGPVLLLRKLRRFLQKQYRLLMPKKTAIPQKVKDKMLEIVVPEIIREKA